MARPIKQGLDYYSIDTNVFMDRKIKKLIRKYNAKGWLIYSYILTEIYRDKGFYITYDNNLVDDISDYFRLEVELITEIIQFCCEITLFNSVLFLEEKILTSESIQKRWQKISNDAKRGIKKVTQVNSKYSLIPEKTEFTPVKTEFSPEVTEFSPEESAQRKEKERKEKESKVTHTKKSENFFENFEEVEVEEIPTLETQEEVPLQKSSAKKVSPSEDVFLNNLSKFQNDYPNTKRFQEICMFNNKPEEFMLKLFDEFIEDNRKSREHATKEDYSYFYQSIDKHFFYWAKAKISKPTTQTKREQQSEIYKAINEGKSINEILGV